MKKNRKLCPLNPAYRPRFRFRLTIIVFVLVLIQISPVHQHSLLLGIESTGCLTEQIIHINKSQFLISNKQAKNIRYSYWVLSHFFRFVTLFLSYRLDRQFYYLVIFILIQVQMVVTIQIIRQPRLIYTIF